MTNIHDLRKQEIKATTRTEAIQEISKLVSLDKEREKRWNADVQEGHLVLSIPLDDLNLGGDRDQAYNLHAISKNGNLHWNSFKAIPVNLQVGEYPLPLEADIKIRTQWKSFVEWHNHHAYDYARQQEEAQPKQAETTDSSDMQVIEINGNIIKVPANADSDLISSIIQASLKL